MKCECGKKAIVELNGKWYCLKCFDKAMADIGRIIDRIIKPALRAE